MLGGEEDWETSVWVNYEKSLVIQMGAPSSIWQSLLTHNDAPVRSKDSFHIDEINPCGPSDPKRRCLLLDGQRTKATLVPSRQYHTYVGIVY